ncbi:hypothetical protein ACP4OV_005529 [Aristida adscensionis]
MPRHGYTVQNCCGSLTCLRSSNGDAELLNPATGESLDLAFWRHGHRSSWTPAEHLPWYCLGCCAATGEYKVLRLDVRLPFSWPPHVTCEVLAVVGRDDGWDSRGRLRPPWKEVGVWHVSYCPADRGVHVAGVVYYLARRQTDLPSSAAAADAVASSLSELDGRLCVSLVVPGGASAAMRVYVLGDDDQQGGKPAWVEMCRLELDGGARRVARPVLVRGRRMLAKRADGSLCYYDMDEARNASLHVLMY